ncbi:MAG: leucine--tRNA ligase [Candidatus Levybacteria bacterium CG_4_10_14_0_8_um_filter_35_23]|nr:MAG: leucine--tRNA ligase [Candidatus Levybacteria bacterium CG_4_10_14_0_8_um_filter_35_23]
MKKSIAKYNPSEIEPKWREVWEKEGTYKPDLESSDKPFYNLMMFPYPSAEGLHAGNMYAFTGADIYGRFKRMQGFSVFEPIGLDGFGIHSENYALKIGKHPMEQAKISEKNFYRLLHETGNSYDWSRTVETYDPKYYKWTQWIFTQMFKKGLAVRKKSPVNFCPSCKTVLADEQVITKIKNQRSKIKDGKEELDGEKVGVCERCETIVEKKNLEQWFFKITDYAERLLNNIPELNWSEIVKIAQTNWIGKSEGMSIEFKIQNSKFKIEVFTTRPDTLFGATFLVLAPEHEIVASLLESRIKNQESRIGEIREYAEKAKKKSDLERQAEGKEKTGVFSGLYAVNPVNNEQIPVWIADYVLASYGTGAIMAVPAHDLRDFEFAKKYNLGIKPVIRDLEEKNKNELAEAYSGDGEIMNSQDWNGWKYPQDKEKVFKWLEEKKIGQKKAHYHLRDWLISRQRYWGPPIPIIYCRKCWENQKSKIKNQKEGRDFIFLDGKEHTIVAVPEKDLPVELPYIENYKPIGTGKSPLATHPEFYNVKCPNCGGDAVRETDVSDTFLDSAWYFLRYLATDWDDMPFPSVKFAQNLKLKTKNLKEIENSALRVAWLPVHMYIGGAEHSVLHLLYSRFMTMFLHDLGLISFEEPFSRFFAHGLLIKEGAKMSKSKGNVIIPDAYIKKFGADTMRCYLMFLGQFSQGGDFYDTGIEGMNRFLKRIWVLAQNVNLSEKEEDKEVLRVLHKTIKGITGDIEKLSYNTSLAKLMEFYNFISDKKTIGKDVLEDFLKLLAPFAPYLSEELFQLFLKSKIKNQKSKMNTNKQLNNKTAKFNSIHLQKWPEFDPKFLVQGEVTIVVQVNGRVRDNFKFQTSNLKLKKNVEEEAKKSEKVKAYLEGKKIIKIIYVEGKIINFVIS